MQAEQTGWRARVSGSPPGVLPAPDSSSKDPLHPPLSTCTPLHHHHHHHHHHHLLHVSHRSGCRGRAITTRGARGGKGAAGGGRPRRFENARQPA